MTNKINDGGAAFPRPAVRQQTVEGIYCDSGQQGMTLRDYFAANAMQGICASAPSPEWTDDFIARDAYGIADAMLKAREEQP